MADHHKNLLDVITEKPNDESGNAFVRHDTSDVTDIANENDGLDESINKPFSSS